LYGVEWCPWVRKARDWLDQHSIQYDWIIVPDRQSDRSEVIEISGQPEVPVIVVTSDDRQHIFLEETHPELSELLNILPEPLST
tara:strand:- start:4528 stop:4779 length:252 start_codon:yes stop_codon:yes gene_type:complete